jgi:hypothetical protein
MPFRVLLAGGLRRNAAGDFSLATLETGAGPVIMYDASAGTQGGIVVRPTGGPVMQLQGPRFLGGGAGLPGDLRALFAGGFNSLALGASAQVDLFDERTVSVAPISVGGEARTLLEPRGGLAVTAVGDGTVVVSGGANATAALLSTVEVFADPSTPPGVAE